MKELKKTALANRNKNKKGVTTLISEKTNLRPKTVKRGHYIMIKGSTHQENTTI